MEDMQNNDVSSVVNLWHWKTKTFSDYAQKIKNNSLCHVRCFI